MIFAEDAIKEKRERAPKIGAGVSIAERCRILWQKIPDTGISKFEIKRIVGLKSYSAVEVWIKKMERNGYLLSEDETGKIFRFMEVGNGLP